MSFLLNAPFQQRSSYQRSHYFRKWAFITVNHRSKVIKQMVTTGVDRHCMLY